MTDSLPWHVYIIRCSDNSLYCGTALDVQARLEKHNSGHGSKYVRSRRPAVLVWSKLFSSRSEACKFECLVKRMSREEKENNFIFT
jgi:putative endonuclease